LFPTLINFNPAAHFIQKLLYCTWNIADSDKN